jgi:hypothetical protein
MTQFGHDDNLQQRKKPIVQFSNNLSILSVIYKKNLGI